MALGEISEPPLTLEPGPRKSILISRGMRSLVHTGWRLILYRSTLQMKPSAISLGFARLAVGDFDWTRHRMEHAQCCQRMGLVAGDMHFRMELPTLW